jgi:hypothetical protein
MTWKQYKKKYEISPLERDVRGRIRLRKLKYRLLFVFGFLCSMVVIYAFANGTVHLQISTFDLNTTLKLISTLTGIVSLYFAAFPPNLYAENTKTKVKDFKRFFPPHYINIHCQDINPADDAERQPVRQSLREIVWDWLFDPNPRQVKKSFLLLLGDFGTGKTTFCYYMGQEIITMLRSMDVEIIQLGRQNLSLADKLKDIPTESRENTVLLLDAYDEYSNRLRGEREFENLLKLTSNFYKVIITSRTHYFSHKDAEPHLATRYISYFSEEQIRRFFKMKYPWRWKSYWKSIKEYENLTDLARRVVLLNYMSVKVIHWMQQQKQQNAGINTFQMYEKIIDTILPGEEGPNETLSRDLAMDVMSVLGFHIVCCDGASRWHYKTMTADLSAILDSLNLRNSKLAHFIQKPEYLETLADRLAEIRTRTFLIRDEPGYYYFAHRSFAEYFAAMFVINRLISKKSVVTIPFQLNRIVQDLIKQAGFESKDIANIVTAISPIYRTASMKLSNDDVKQMLYQNDFYDREMNNSGKGMSHEYEVFSIAGDKVICDFATGLMWQQSGSPGQYLKMDKAMTYIEELNDDIFAGFNDWRLPTLEEAMSLIEKTRNNELHIVSLFDSKQSRIWTSDLIADQSRAWVVLFVYGDCNLNYGYYYVRAVRS